MKLINNKTQHEVALKLLRIIDISHEMCNTDPTDFGTVAALMNEHGDIMADVIYDICGSKEMEFVINELSHRTENSINKLEGMLDDIGKDMDI